MIRYVEHVAPFRRTHANWFGGTGKKRRFLSLSRNERQRKSCTEYSVCCGWRHGNADDEMANNAQGSSGKSFCCVHVFPMHSQSSHSTQTHPRKLPQCKRRQKNLCSPHAIPRSSSAREITERTTSSWTEQMCSVRAMSQHPPFVQHFNLTEERNSSRCCGVAKH